jgi:hypothetical protein
MAEQSDSPSSDAALHDLAAAVRQPAGPRLPTPLSGAQPNAGAPPAYPTAPPPLPSQPAPPPRLVILALQLCSVAFLGFGLLVCIAAMLSWNAEAPFFHFEWTSTSFEFHGWGLAAGLAVALLAISKLQSVAAKLLLGSKVKHP